MKLTDEQFEVLESLRHSDAWKVLNIVRDAEAERLVRDSAIACDRHIQNGNITIIETAANRVARNSGVLSGMDYLLQTIDSAERVRRKTA